MHHPMKRISLLLISLLFSCNLFSQQFWHQYSPTYFYFNASTPTPDGGLMIVTNATDSTWLVPRMMRIDSVGNIIWSIQADLFPDFNPGRFVDVIPTYDNCYVAVGQMMSGSTYAGLLLHKFDVNGTAKWTKLLYPVSCGGNITGGYESHCIIEAKDNGLVVSGSCGAQGGEGMFIFKTDSSGNPQWFKVYYDNNDLNFWYRNLCRDNDSGFVFFNQYGSMNKDGFLIHTDKSGNTLMSATLDSLNGSSLNALFNFDGQMYLCFDNGFIKTNLDTGNFWLPRYTFPFGGYQFKSMEKCMNSDFIISWSLQGGSFGTLRTDSTGIPVWAHNQNKMLIANDFFERPDGKLIFQGTNLMGTNYTEVILFDSTGNMDCFDPPVSVTFDSVPEGLHLSPGYEVACGMAVYVPSLTWHDVGAMTDLCVGANATNHDAPRIEVFPNPTSGKFKLTGLSGTSAIEVVGIDGRHVTSIETNDQSVNIDLSNYPKSIYAIRIIKDGIPNMIKIVLE